MKNCTLYPTNKENWSNFVALTSRELSDFQSWAMRKAFSQIGLESVNDDNCWYWLNGKLCQDLYNDERKHCLTYELCLTANGILFLREFECTTEEYRQTMQYVISLDL